MSTQASENASGVVGPKQSIHDYFHKIERNIAMAGEIDVNGQSIDRGMFNPLPPTLHECEAIVSDAMLNLSRLRRWLFTFGKATSFQEGEEAAASFNKLQPSLEAWLSDERTYGSTGFVEVLFRVHVASNMINVDLLNKWDALPSETEWMATLEPAFISIIDACCSSSHRIPFPAGSGSIDVELFIDDRLHVRYVELNLAIVSCSGVFKWLLGGTRSAGSPVELALRFPDALTKKVERLIWAIPRIKEPRNGRIVFQNASVDEIHRNDDGGEIHAKEREVLKSLVDAGFAAFITIAGDAPAVERCSAIMNGMLDEADGNEDRFAWGWRTWRVELRKRKHCFSSKTIMATGKLKDGAWARIMRHRTGAKNERLVSEETAESFLKRESL